MPFTTAKSSARGSRKQSHSRGSDYAAAPRGRAAAPANISAKRGRPTTSPHMVLTADVLTKRPSHVVTEVLLTPQVLFAAQTLPPPDLKRPISRLHRPPQQLPGRTSSFTMPSPCTADATTVNSPYSPYFPFDSPKSTPETSDDNDSPTYLFPVTSRTGSPDDPTGPAPATLQTALGAGRLDPFSVYCKQDLALEVHEMIDHNLQHVCCSFTLATKPVEIDKVKAYIMGHAMSDPITFYAIILAGVTHYIFSHGENEVSPEVRMLRLSYKTQAMVEIRKDIEQRQGKVSDACLFAINTLAAHGGGDFGKGGLSLDRTQDGKALGNANALNYYSAIETEWDHWNIFTKLMRQRGGPGTLEHPANVRGFPPSPGPGCMTTTDVLIAWRNLQCPEFPLWVSTDKVIDLQRLERDPPAALLMQKLLSGFPAMPRNNMHSRRLTALLKKTRTLLVDFDQYQRDVQQKPAKETKVDIRLLYWTRLMLLHDLLLLPDLSLSDNPLELMYELCRNGLLAFEQLVLVPVAASNRLPEKLLTNLLPLLQRCVTSIHGRTLDREHPSLFLWAVMMAGMLAMEHYVAFGNSTLLDKVSAFFDRVSIKPEKNAWSMAAAMLRSFLWLDSECDTPGQRYWNYACLWLAERTRNQAQAEAEAAETIEIFPG
ncbi:uncharacterized protein AB675_10136 [Cyphellophora attinorum]|uniref:Uncharacterized protein n=1 Tax=Cyphellophora attinorum TaxID=1664694 RepID=A0A0N0NIA8_9EURO|nr:uncharacterized protein AB675_10136 [Phialophora attinorum]KPI35219.1 hypothetical protein AB675_10136 [Phialophora attinorum]